MKKTYAGLVGLLLLGCVSEPEKPAVSQTVWELEDSAAGLVDDRLTAQIFKALDKAENAGTDPSLSAHHVRVATTVEDNGAEQVIVGGNTEYYLPEAIHGETSLLNHVTNLLGPEATRQKVRFLAFYVQEKCGDSLGCGDCRDYEMAVTNYEQLLIVCGQASDRKVLVRRFTEAVLPEEQFPEVTASDIPLNEEELQRLVREAREARQNGVQLFTSEKDHAGAAALSHQGRVYRAASADDAAFHYRYPIGGLLQQAASQGDYYLKAILVAGEADQWPRISYRDRQYGHEFSSFNSRRQRPPIVLILTDGQKYRMTTFEEALPHAFSIDAFMPGRVTEFLESRTAPETLR